MKKTKIYIFGFLLILMLLVAFGCADNPSPVPANEAFPPEFKGFMQGKRIYLTSIGQSIEVENLSENLKGFPEINYVQNNFLDALEIPRGSVVFVVVGCSIKAMSESGIQVEAEAMRMREFNKRANNKEITLVTWHIGGMARRGSTSDSFIQELIESSSLFLFSATGNQDGMLSAWAEQAQTPYCQFRTGIASMLRNLR